jgi:SAM-dependent methyltransferase
MIQQPTPKGVLASHYAEARSIKKELGFRFQVRGEAVAWAVEQFLDPTQRFGSTLLDMGAADGKTLKYIDQLLKLKKGTGIEYNPELMGKAENLPEHLCLQHGDVTNLSDIGDATYSIVSALAILEHLPDPSLAVQEAARILQPGGLLIASSPVPFWDHLSVRLGLLLEDHHECDMHSKLFKSIFKKTPNLRLLHFQRFMWAPIGIMPYFGLSVSPHRAFSIDRTIEKYKVTNWLFVNQLAVGIKK